MQIAVNALFTHDERGRIVRVNEPDGDIAPRFFLGRTKQGNLWRVRHDLPKAIAEQLDVLARGEPIPRNLREPPMYLDAFKQVLEAHAPVQDIYIGPEYRFSDGIGETDLATRLTGDNAECLRPYFPYMIPSLGVMPPVFAVVVEGQAVSVCFSSRTTALADEAGLETIEGYRGRGYAQAVVAAWAWAIRALGRTPIYGTSWDNAASQRVASKLGLILFGAGLSIS